MPKPMKLLSKKIPLYFVLLASLLGALISYSFISFKKNDNNDSSVQTGTPVSATESCSFNINRLGGHKFIKPLLYAEKTCEADKFVGVKSSVTNLIEEFKTKGEITDASVYLRLFSKGEWTSINDEKKYEPGSLFKVPLLITYLRLAEHNPALLNKKITFNLISNESKGLKQEFLKNAIKIGESYAVNELFRYMIVHSDNNATMLLMNNISFEEFQKTFTDMGISKELTKNDAVISAREYSVFWLALYNGSYLNFDNSEYALSLLSQTDFSEGILKGLPQGTRISHKFGEKGNITTHIHNLSETAIVYINNNSYLLTIMTKGNDQAKLPKVIQAISSQVYNNVEGFTR